MTGSDAPAQNAAEYLAEHFERFTNELLEFLSIPSISALPEHAPHVAAAADANEIWRQGRVACGDEGEGEGG